MLGQWSERLQLETWILHMARVRDPSYDFQMTMVTCSNDIQTPRCKAWWRHLSTVGLTSSKSLPACAVLKRGSFTVRTSVLQLRVLYKILLTHHGGSVADGPLHTILIVTCGLVVRALAVGDLNSSHGPSSRPVIWFSNDHGDMLKWQEIVESYAYDSC